MNKNEEAEELQRQLREGPLHKITLLFGYKEKHLLDAAEEEVNSNDYGRGTTAEKLERLAKCAIHEYLKKAKNEKIEQRLKETLQQQGWQIKQEVKE